MPTVAALGRPKISKEKKKKAKKKTTKKNGSNTKLVVTGGSRGRKAPVEFVFDAHGAGLGCAQVVSKAKARVNSRQRKKAAKHKVNGGLCTR